MGWPGVGGGGPPNGPPTTVTAFEARQLLRSLDSLTFFLASAHAITRYAPGLVPAGTVSLSVAFAVFLTAIALTLRVLSLRSSLLFFASRDRAKAVWEPLAFLRPEFLTLTWTESAWPGGRRAGRLDAPTL